MQLSNVLAFHRSLEISSCLFFSILNPLDAFTVLCIFTLWCSSLVWRHACAIICSLISKFSWKLILFLQYHLHIGAMSYLYMPSFHYFLTVLWSIYFFNKDLHLTRVLLPYHQLSPINLQTWPVYLSFPLNLQLISSLGASKAFTSAFIQFPT